LTTPPPTDRSGGEPSAEDLLALDAFLDALAEVPATPPPGPPPVSVGSVDPGLAAVAHRLGDLPEAVWESVAPLYQPLRAVPPAIDLPATPATPTTSTPAVEVGPAAGTQPFRRDGRGHRRDPVRRGRRSAVVGWVSAAAAVVVVLTVIGIHTFSGQPPTRPVTGVSTVPPWRLAGFIEQQAWQQSGTSAAVASSVAVTCPVAGTCYADNLGGGQTVAVVERTTDGGSSWQASSLPTGIRLTSSPACTTAADCVVAGVMVAGADGATGATGSVVAITADGGTSWTTRPVPGVSQLVSLTCLGGTDGGVGTDSGANCVGVGYGEPTATNPTGESVTARSTDGGTTWSVAPLAATFSPSWPDGLSCVGEQCVVTGTDGATATSTVTARAAAWYSTDGGVTWSPSTVSPGPAVLQAVSCVGPHCVGAAFGPAGSAGSSATARPYGPSQAMASADGGRTWGPAGSNGLPAAYLSTVACSTATQCWAGGFLATSGGAPPAGVLVSTADGGVTWTTVALPTTHTTSQQPGGGPTGVDIENVSSVSCAASSRCLAMAAQGSSADPSQQHLALAN